MLERIIIAIFFLFFMVLAMSLNNPNGIDIFDIAAFILGFGGIAVLIKD